MAATITQYPNADALLGYLDEVTGDLNQILFIAVDRAGVGKIGIVGMTPEDAVDLIERTADSFGRQEPEDREPEGERNGTDAEDGEP